MVFRGLVEASGGLIVENGVTTLHLHFPTPPLPPIPPLSPHHRGPVENYVFHAIYEVYHVTYRKHL